MNRIAPTLRLVVALILIVSSQTSTGYSQEETKPKPKSKLKVTFRSDNNKKKTTKLRLASPKKKTSIPKKRLTLKSNSSVELKRIQRSPSGKIDATNFERQLSADKRKAGRFQSPKLSDMANNKRPSTKLNSSSTTKRFGGRFQSPKLSDMANTKRPSTKLNAGSTTKRFGGKFRPIKSLPSTGRPKTALPVKKSPVKSKAKFTGKTVGKGLGGLAIAGVGKSAVDNMKNAKDAYKNGNITKSQYRKSQKKNVTEAAGKAYKLTKLNPGALLLNDVVGTDPLSLGVDAALDLVNGTDNAKQSLKNVKKSWNKSLTKQVFTDPKGAGDRVTKGAKKVGNGVKSGAKKVGNGVKKGAKKVGNFFKSKFKSKKKK